MSDMLEKMKAYLETDAGKESIRQWGLKIQREAAHKERWVEKFKQRCEGDLDTAIDELIKKYYSDEYRDREYYKCKCEPREPLLWLAYEYASTYCKPYNGKKHINMFTADAYHFGSYVIQLMMGQGSALRIDKK